MDFFEQQDVARRRTRELVFLFGISVILILIAVNLVVFLIFGATTTVRRTSEPFRDYDNPPAAIDSYDPSHLFITTSAVVLLIIGGGSLYKMAALSGGGSSVAQLLGGRPLDPNTASNPENTLRNVVEEMAIASGVPVPQIYILDHEEGINAFAAGFNPSNTVIGVTRGAVEKLNRDELQGVIGHEFSHILNGDTRLNLKLVSLLNGILVVSLIGAGIMRSFQYASWGSRRRDRDNSAAGILLLGIAVYAIGSIGVFFARIIQAAVSRQREFLADASAVQFTRNPAGLAGALKKLGHFSSGSKIVNHHAMETAHLFFANSAGFFFGDWLDTHPPLVERIKRLDPTFDGKFDITGDSHLLEEYDGKSTSIESGEAIPVSAMRLTRQIGQATPGHLIFAAALLKSFPDSLSAQAHDPFSARAVILALLASDHSDIRSKQLARIAQNVEPACIQQMTSLLPQIETIKEGARLPLFDLALPALRSLSPQQALAFRAAVKAMIEADGKVTLFEYALYRTLERTLSPQDATQREPVEFVAINAVRDEAATLLSALAHASTAQTDRAFLLGSRQLDPDKPMNMTANPGLAAIDAALKKLARCSPPVKKRLIDAAATTIAADGEVNVAESELLRATAASLGVPIPPLVSQEIGTTDEHR